MSKQGAWPAGWRAWGLLIGIVLMLMTRPAAALSDPRETAALDEMGTLAAALELCAADTGYYVSLETLDDGVSLDAVAPYNYLNQNGGTWVIYPPEGRFRAQQADFVKGAVRWGGPYVVYQPSKVQTGATPYDQGSPLDPWGNSYYFFSPLGLVRGDGGRITLELYGDAFDRYTLVSLGADGIVSDDDLIYPFGGGVTGLVLTSVRPLPPAGGAGLKAAGALAPATRPDPAALRLAASTTDTQTFTAQAGTPIAIRGKNLGATQGEATILFGKQPLTAITSWSADEIRLTLPATLNGSDALTVRRGTAESNPLTLRVTPAAVNAAHDWAFYP